MLILHELFVYILSRALRQWRVIELLTEGVLRKTFTNKYRHRIKIRYANGLWYKSSDARK